MPYFNWTNNSFQKIIYELYYNLIDAEADEIHSVRIREICEDFKFELAQRFSIPRMQRDEWVERIMDSVFEDDEEYIKFIRKSIVAIADLILPNIITERYILESLTSNGGISLLKNYEKLVHPYFKEYVEQFKNLMIEAANEND
jgi:hypothetical protein